MPFRIQKAGPGEGPGSAIFVHFKPEDAEREIANELPHILENVRSSMYELHEAGFADDFLRAVEDVLIGAGDALKMGDLWEAYERWREFMDSWGPTGGYPLVEWWGDIIVEDSKADKFYFFKEPPPKRPKLSGYALGAMRLWRIYTTDAFQQKHPFSTMSEDAAKQKVAWTLRNFTLDVLKSQVDMWAYIGPRQNNEHAEFVKDGRKLIKSIQSDLDNDKVWKAYHRLKKFEKEYEKDFPDFGIAGVLGVLIVEPEPPSE